MADIFFVDDACYMVTAGTAKALLSRLRRVAALVHSIFEKVQLSVNYAKGKTEAMVALRGKMASKAFAELRTDQGLRLKVDEPDLQVALEICVVTQYAHLGTTLQANGRQQANAKAREGKAMTSYAPISKKIFGCPRVSTWLKLHFLNSLIWTRCAFNLHIFPPAACVLKRANRVHMRALRRITDCISGVSDGHCKSNVEVRRLVGEPCVDCLLTRARLTYAHRVAENGPVQLHAILNNNGMPLEWPRQIERDIGRLQRTIGIAGSPWVFLQRCPKELWRQHVAKLFWDESSADPVTSDWTSADHACSFACHLCSEPSGKARQFSSLKGLQAHQRVSHAVRTPMRFYAPESGTCPACGTAFRHRLRLLSHLCDSRRPKCRNACLASPSIVPLPLEEVSRLDLLDREAKTAAARKGHTHVLAVGAALTKEGKVTGRTML